jgi:hypothetical protein
MVMLHPGEEPTKGSALTMKWWQELLRAEAILLMKISGAAIIAIIIILFLWGIGYYDRLP